MRGFLLQVEISQSPCNAMRFPGFSEGRRVLLYPDGVLEPRHWQLGI